MVGVGLFAVAIAVSVVGYGTIKRSKKIEDINLRVQSMSFSLF